MRLAAICVGAVVMVGCGAEETAKDVKETVDPVAEAADKMAKSGGARVDGDMNVRLGQLTIPMRMDGAVSFEDRVAQFVRNYS